MSGHRGIVVRVLSWNLFHGRDFPPDRSLFTWRSRLLRRTEQNDTHAQVNRPLLEEFADWLGGRPWELALLQEAPPRWFRALAGRCHANAAMALTSRNWLAVLRGLLADSNPDLLASNEGGSNQILVRAPTEIVEVRRLTLTRSPERRRMLWARVELPGGCALCVANLHASAGDPPAAAREVERAAELALEWTGADPLVFGGDLNLRQRRSPEVFESLRDRFGLGSATSPGAIDHLLVRGLQVVEPPVGLMPEQREVEAGGLRIRLSDHAPVVAAFRHDIVRAEVGKSH
jgi:endonuclease/exonuclease/phosphatase family metal-dependent hydrolase